MPFLKQIAGTALMLSLLLGVVVAVVGVLFANQILQLIGTPPDILPITESYARIIFISLPLVFFYLVYTTILRGVGDTLTPFGILAFVTAMTLLLTPSLVLGWFGLPKFGVNGAAYSNVIATFVGVAVMIFVLRVRKSPLALNADIITHARLDLPTVMAIVRLGVPTGLQLVMVSLSEIAVIVFVNRFGSEATAAYGAVNQVVSYVQFPAISIGIAASIFGAQSIGAGRLDRLRKIIYSGVALNYAIGGVLIGLTYLFSRAILALFLTDQHTLEIAHTLLTITLWSYLIFGHASVLSGLMRSSGTVFWPTTLTILAIWGIEVPVAFVLSQRIGLNGVWIAYPIAYCAILAFQSIYYKFFWKKRKIEALVAAQ
jgi:putative MATE family efflux protein